LKLKFAMVGKISSRYLASPNRIFGLSRKAESLAPKLGIQCHMSAIPNRDSARNSKESRDRGELTVNHIKAEMPPRIPVPSCLAVSSCESYSISTSWTLRTD
jgi:hypothetical protein